MAAPATVRAALAEDQGHVHCPLLPLGSVDEHDHGPLHGPQLPQAEDQRHVHCPQLPLESVDEHDHGPVHCPQLPLAEDQGHGGRHSVHCPLLPLGEPSLAFVSQRPCFAFASTSVFERLAAVRAAGRHDVEDTEAELLD